MLPLLPHYTHTHITPNHHTHTCCLAGANNSNSAGVNSSGWDAILQIDACIFLTVTLKPTLQTAAAAISEILGISSFAL